MFRKASSGAIRQILHALGVDAIGESERLLKVGAFNLRR